MRSASTPEPGRDRTSLPHLDSSGLRSSSDTSSDRQGSDMCRRSDIPRVEMNRGDEGVIALSSLHSSRATGVAFSSSRPVLSVWRNLQLVSEHDLSEPKGPGLSHTVRFRHDERRVATGTN